MSPVFLESDQDFWERVEPTIEAPLGTFRWFQINAEPFLDHLRGVGPDKPLAYLPVDTIERAGSTASNEVEIAGLSGLCTALFQRSERNAGCAALYIFDWSALNQLLQLHRELLRASKIPTEPEPFVKYIAQTDVPPKTREFDIVAECFGDFSNPDRLVRGTKRSTGEFLS